ncbi:hypothetical protein [Bacillus paranthracis]|uniref:hypothetical protein n=1 Tax=Bacillus paranthracis TaxID=2026186 RepID=UPI00220E695A|nr:hypothetical protein [Bacillus paranthracis]UXR28949.1 membrane protein [Bacillus phage Nachito]
MFDSIVIYCTILFIFVIGVMAHRVAKAEREAYNGGKCACGGTWRTFDMDSQGGTGLKCTKCKRYLWTSWVKIRKESV